MSTKELVNESCATGASIPRHSSSNPDISGKDDDDDDGDDDVDGMIVAAVDVDGKNETCDAKMNVTTVGMTMIPMLIPYTAVELLQNKPCNKVNATHTCSSNLCVRGV